MKTIETYLAYVKSVLNEISKDQEVKASYDTGFGLHLTNEYLGDSPMTIDVVGHSIAKVRDPEIDNFDEWERAWSAGKAMVRKFIEQRTRK